MSKRVPEVFADGVVVAGGLTTLFFITDYEGGIADLDRPLAAVMDCDVAPPEMRGPSDDGYEPEKFLRTAMLPPAASSQPVLILSKTMAPAIQSLLVLQKLRGFVRAAVVRCEEPAVMATLLGVPVMRSPGDLAKPGNYASLARTVATRDRAWLWLGKGRSIPSATCENLVLPRSESPLQAAFGAWKAKRDRSAQAPFSIPVGETGDPALVRVEQLGSPTAATPWDGVIGLVKGRLTSKETGRLVPFLKAWPGKKKGVLVLGYSDVDSTALQLLRQAVGSLPYPLLLGAAPAASDLEDLAAATGALELQPELGVSAASLDDSNLGRFRHARVASGNLRLEGEGKSSAWKALIRQMNIDYLNAESPEERQEIARRGARFLGSISQSARDSLMRF